VEITINSMIKIRRPDPTLKDILVEKLTHKNPKFLDAEKMGKSTRKIDEFIHFFKFDGAGSLYVPRGVRELVLSLVTQLGQTAKVIDERTFKPITSSYIDSSAIQYRPYQFPAINQLFEADPEGVLVAPAGSGKTVMGLSFIPITQQPTLWLTHTDRLFKQCYERSEQFLPGITGDQIGFIGGGKWDVGSVLTIGMIPTLVRNLPRLAELQNYFGLVITDECHHVPATTFHKVITLLNPYYMYGLTATPYRRDGLEQLMFQCIGPIRATIDKKDVVKSKGIVLPTVIYCGVNYGPLVNISNIPTIFNEFIVFNEERNYRIKRDVLAEAYKNNFCIVVSGRKNHCELLYKQIKAEWPATGIATGKYSKKKIDEQVANFNDKQITVLVTTPELLGEGFDVDFLNRLFITTPFRTEQRLEQLVGRVQRFHPDKKDARVYDYVDENIGVLQNQFFSKHSNCRTNVYNRLGLKMIDYGELIV